MKNKFNKFCTFMLTISLLLTTVANVVKASEADSKNATSTVSEAASSTPEDTNKKKAIKDNNTPETPEKLNKVEESKDLEAASKQDTPLSEKQTDKAQGSANSDNADKGLAANALVEGKAAKADKSLDKGDSTTGKEIAVRANAAPKEEGKPAGKGEESTDAQVTSTNARYTFDVNWKNGVSGDVKDYSYDANDKTILNFHPQNNTTQTATLSVNLKLQADAQQPYKKGAVKITIPKTLFKSWQDNDNVNFYYWEYKPQLKWQLVPEGKTSNASSFNYTESDDKNFYIVTNYEDITSAQTFNFEPAYSFRPSHVKLADGEKTSTNYEIKLEIEVNGQKTTETKKFTVNLANKNENMQLTLKPEHLTENKGIYFDWQDTWGKKPTDADEFFYIVWYTDVTKPQTNTIPYSFKLAQEKAYETANDPKEGELIGVKVYGHNYYGNGASFTTKESIDSFTNVRHPEINGHLELLQQDALLSAFGNKDVRLWYDSLNWDTVRFVMLKKYKKSLITDAKKAGTDLAKNGLKIENKVSLVEKLQTGKELEIVTATADTTIYIVSYGGKTTIEKYGVGNEANQFFRLNNYDGRLTLLSNDKEALLSNNDNYTFYTTVTSAAPTEPTWDTANNKYQTEYTAEIDEGKLYYFKQSDITKEVGLGSELSKFTAKNALQTDDYYYSKLCVSIAGHDAKKTSLNNWQLDYNLGKDADKYGAIEVWVKKANESNYSKYGEFKVDVNNDKLSYTFKYADNSTPDSTGEVITFKKDDKITAIKYKYTSKYYRTNFKAHTQVALLPTNNVKSILPAAKDAGLLYISSEASMKLNHNKNVTNSSTQAQSTYLSTVSLNHLNYSTGSSNQQVYDLIDDTVNSLQTGNVYLEFGQYSSLWNTGVQDVSYFEKNIFKEVNIYDLLPAGTTIKKDSISISAGQWNSEETIGASEYKIEYIDNFNDTGRTLMKINLTLKNDAADISKYTNHGFKIKVNFDLINS